MFCPPRKLENGFISFSVHGMVNVTLSTLVQASSKGSRRPVISLMRTHVPEHTARKDVLEEENI